MFDTMSIAQYALVFFFARRAPYSSSLLVRHARRTWRARARLPRTVVTRALMQKRRARVFTFLLFIRFVFVLHADPALTAARIVLRGTRAELRAYACHGCTRRVTHILAVHRSGGCTRRVTHSSRVSAFTSHQHIAHTPPSCTMRVRPMLLSPSRPSDQSFSFRPHGISLLPMSFRFVFVRIAYVILSPHFANHMLSLPRLPLSLR